MVYVKFIRIKYRNWKFHNNGYLYTSPTYTSNIYCLEYLSNKNIEISDFKIEGNQILFDYQYIFITNYFNKTIIDVPFYIILDYYLTVQKMKISLDDIKNVIFEIDCINEYKISYDDNKYLTIKEIIDKFV